MQITVEEVEAAIVKLKNNRLPGICGISAKMLKAGKVVVVKWLGIMEKSQKTGEEH